MILMSQVLEYIQHLKYRITLFDCENSIIANCELLVFK